MTTDQKPFPVIVSGPSKFDLMLALFDNEESEKRLVAFETQSIDGQKRVIKVNVQSAGRTADQDVWHIEGMLMRNSVTFIAMCQITFSTRNRHGSITTTIA